MDAETIEIVGLSDSELNVSHGSAASDQDVAAGMTAAIAADLPPVPKETPKEPAADEKPAAEARAEGEKPADEKPSDKADPPAGDKPADEKRADDKEPAPKVEEEKPSEQEAGDDKPEDEEPGDAKKTSTLRSRRAKRDREAGRRTGRR